MQAVLRSKLFFHAAFLCILTLLFAVSTVQAQAENVHVNIAFDQSVVVIGRTPRLAIQITNGNVNPIRATRFECIAQGSALTASSISQRPAVIAANGSHTTEQYYRAAAPGITQVHCELTAVDTVTGAQINAVSPTLSVEVLAETRLAFGASSGTRIATIGQAVFLNAVYGNRGQTSFTNIEVSCVQLGRSLEFVSNTPVQTTLPGGQSAFVQYRLQAVRVGAAPLACSITATDSSTGSTITLPAPTVNIEVR